MAKKSIIKKQHINIIVVLAVILTGITIFGKQYFSKLQYNTRFHTCINQDGSTFETTEPCENYLQKEETSNTTVSLDPDKPDLVTFQAGYFAVKYPNNWNYVGHDGGLGNLFEYLQITDVQVEEMYDGNPNLPAIISIQANKKGFFGDFIGNAHYTGKSLDEYIKDTLKELGNNYKSRRVDGTSGWLVEEPSADCCKINMYQLVIHNDIFYNISLNVNASNMKELDEKSKKYRNDFDTVLDNFKFND